MPTTIRSLLSREPLNVSTGLLILRLGAGLSLAIHHGWGKITGGPEMWTQVGGAMAKFGLGFAPAMWGFLAAFAEFGAALLVVAGVLFRPAAAMVAFTMFIAVTQHLTMPPDSPHAGWNGASHAMELMSVFLCLLLTGPGKYRLIR